VLVQLIPLASMVQGARLAGTPLTWARLHGFRLNAASMSLVTNVSDTEQLRWAFWRPDYLSSLVPYMREKRLSVFDEPNSWLLGKLLESSFSLAPPGQCTGGLESSVAMSTVAAGPSARRITGWAWDLQRRQPPALMVIATGGVITGLGATGDSRPMNKALRPWITTNYTGYTGYVQEARPPGPVEIYAILNGRPATACLIATLQ
jgi:hypothetical protein